MRSALACALGLTAAAVALAASPLLALSYLLGRAGMALMTEPVTPAVTVPNVPLNATIVNDVQASSVQQ